MRALVLFVIVGCGRLGFGGSDDAGDDGGGCVPMSPCSIVPQLGCCGGESCYLGTGDVATCLMMGVAAENEHCVRTSDCSAGLGCVGESGYFACHRYCGTDADCTGAGSLCIYTVGSSTTRVCSQSCEPIADIGCAPDGGCRVRRSGTRFVTECAFAGTATQGQSCNSEADCDGGYSCVSNVCQKICRVGGSDCATGFCVPNFPAATINGVEYGACS